MVVLNHDIFLTNDLITRTQVIQPDACRRDGIGLRFNIIYDFQVISIHRNPDIKWIGFGKLIMLDGILQQDLQGNASARMPSVL